MISKHATQAKRLRKTSLQEDIYRLVLHITGRQTWLNAERAKEDPMDRLERLFCTVGNPSVAHYGIGPWGEIRCFMDEKYRPWSQGYGEKLGSVEDVRKLEPQWWWREKWGGTLHPVSLLNGRTSPNEGTVSVEIVQFGNQLCPTIAQYRALRTLARDICERNRLHVMYDVLGHEDLVPWTRGNSGGGWDPGEARDEPTFSYAPISVTEEYLERMLADMVFIGTAIDTPEIPEWMKRYQIEVQDEEGNSHSIAPETSYAEEAEDGLFVSFEDCDEIEQERAMIVAFLRVRNQRYGARGVIEAEALESAADAIESGEHLEGEG